MKQIYNPFCDFKYDFNHIKVVKIPLWPANDCISKAKSRLDVSDFTAGWVFLCRLHEKASQWVNFA